MAAPGPDLPPRPRPGFGKQSSGGAASRAPGPPVPAPRGSKVSALAESFQGSLGGSGSYPLQSPTLRNTVAATPPPVPTTSRPAPLAPLNHVTSELPSTPPPSLPSRRTISETGKLSPISVVSPSPSDVISGSSPEGFGLCLQNCYDTINKKHEDELLALESFRNHVFARSRLDKDYSDNMSKMNMKASRKMNSVGNKSSAIMKVYPKIVLADLSTTMP